MMAWPISAAYDAEGFSEVRGPGGKTYGVSFPPAYSPGSYFRLGPASAGDAKGLLMGDELMPVLFDSPERTGLSMGGGDDGGSGGNIVRPRGARRSLDGVVSNDVLVDGPVG